ncbi:MAG: hypothetical protein WEC00_06405 [Dongiaceae bacterium]
MTKRMLIMIAGPYRSGADSDGERTENLLALNRVALRVWNLGHIPVVGVNLVLPIVDVAGQDRYSELMMPICLKLAERCDAVIRVGGPSSGADREVALIRDKGGIVFTQVEDIPPYHDRSDRI